MAPSFLPLLGVSGTISTGGGGSPTYINSIQNISITIAASASTGTTNINPAVGKQFIIWQGQTNTASTNMSTGCAALTISGAVVTATRTNTDTTTVTVNAVVVDATSALITSVQFGTISFTSGLTSNTATISAVNNATTAVVYLGSRTNDTTVSYSNNDFLLSLSGTIVTGSRQFGGFTNVLAFCVIEFNPTAITSCNSYAATTASPGATTWTKAIASVTTTKAFLLYAGSYGNSGSSAGTVRPKIAITGATVVTMTTGATSFVTQAANFTVIELASGVLNSNVQRGSLTISSGTNNTAAISPAMNANLSFCAFSNNSTNDISGALDKDYARIAQTSGSLLTGTVNTAATISIAYEAVEFIP